MYERSSWTRSAADLLRASSTVEGLPGLNEFDA
jgi:hypothetical protein